MQFQVPQFIDIPDKMFGPFTAKQFLYLAGGAGICFVVIKFLPTVIGIIVAIPVAAFSLALAFYKVNNRPFVFVVQSYIYYLFSSKLYLWKKEHKMQEMKRVEDALPEEDQTPRLSESKLKQLSWSLDVLDIEKKPKA